MARTVPEWIGKTDDSEIPGDVKLRLWNRAAGFCQCCTRKIMAGEPKHFDHIKPLIDGGANAEGNIQVLCLACHGDKTSAEATGRAAMRSKAKAVLGLKPKAKVKIPSPPKPAKPVKDKLAVPPRRNPWTGEVYL